MDTPRWFSCHFYKGDYFNRLGVGFLQVNHISVIGCSSRQEFALSVNWDFFFSECLFMQISLNTSLMF